jgi:two-component system, cell cycle sensor histidine kinase PleC
VIQSEDLGPLGNDAYRECLGMLSETAEHTMQVTDRMLDFSRLSSGNIELREQPICIGESLVFAMELTRPLRLERKVDVKLPSESIELRMTGDRAYVLQMLTNLIANAIKYGPDDSTVLLSATQSPTNEITISVTDHGYGMAHEEIASALTPFVRLNDVQDNASDGIGVGLPIVKHLIEMHGGRLEIESEKSVGTTVSLVFPAYRCVESGMPAVQSGIVRTAATG